MPTKKPAALVVCLVVLLGVFALPSLARAQGRVNDKDMEILLRNVRDDAKSFEPVFNDAVKHSVIRKTSREKDAGNLVNHFVKQTDGAFNTFKKTRRADDTLPNVLATSAQINKLVYDLHFDAKATSRWEKIRSELHQLAIAEGVPDPLDTVAGAGPDFQGNQPCWQAVGQQRAQQIASECSQVSPSTYPPCDVQNACSLITNEIRRGCERIGEGAPSFCAEYR